MAKALPFSLSTTHPNHHSWLKTKCLFRKAERSASKPARPAGLLRVTPEPSSHACRCWGKLRIPLCREIRFVASFRLQITVKAKLAYEYSCVSDCRLLCFGSPWLTLRRHLRSFAVQPNSATEYRNSALSSPRSGTGNKLSPQASRPAGRRQFNTVKCLASS